MMSPRSPQKVFRRHRWRPWFGAVAATVPVEETEMEEIEMLKLPKRRHSSGLPP